MIDGDADREGDYAAGRPRYAWRTNYDDAARFHSMLRVHQMVLSFEEVAAGRFMAVRLSDGGSDGMIYESQADAVRHQTGNQNYYLYVRIMPERLSNRSCDVMLWYGRIRHDRGYRPAGAHEGSRLILPMRLEDLNNVD